MEELRNLKSRFKKINFCHVNTKAARGLLGLKRLDTYIISKFIGTYFFSILLIISISIVFDFNENLSKFTQYHAPWQAIVFDYYANFVPYFANLFSPLFCFIAVIFFTSKLAGNSEIIAIIAAGVGFRRLMRPYMISCVMISVMSFYLASYVIPKGNVVRQNFESMYKNNKKNTSADNVQLQVDKGVIAYIQHYDNIHKTGFGFCLDKFENKKLVSHMTASCVQYDTLANAKYHWKATNWKIREMRGMREKISSGNEIDTLIQMEPMDLVFSKGQQETFTSPQLKDYINKQIDRGSKNIVQYEVEYHKRIASSFASFILTVIGVSLSSRKRKGGMGLYLGIGLALSFIYIMLQTICATFAINAGAPPAIAAWMPNIIFGTVAYFCYRNAPK
ncbi:MAG: LptF/LptG family permease [Bacteroidales bacterium]|nr:LptF/LptG family permease [Bacteroidales bacterium]MCM1147910.1 LptF/LptG family permease [Bacteroidales bacterium]MCM1205459.1 LptF/LptG family permease [Bacillota bacterium]MCM1509279.1 LptF/LptG family permease [Clostridium sp.]